jgi:tetratricopeptide (TPR) repeat protein
VLGIGLGLFTAYLERHYVGAQGTDWELTFWQRVLVAGRGLWFYAGKLVYPAALTFIYPRWDPAGAGPADWIAPLGFLLTVLALWLGRRNIGRGPLVSVLFFAVTLSPALGFLDVYPFRFSFVADHFQYPASLGILVLVVGAAGRVLGRAGGKLRAWGGRPAAAAVLGVLGLLTWNQCKIYRDAETLWRDTLAKNPRAWMPHFNLGLILHQRGDVDGAFRHYLETVRWRPDHYKAHTVLARIYTERNDLDKAVEHYRLALKVDPQLLTPNINLGNIYASRGQYAEAIRLYRAALAARSPLPEADFALANTLLATGDYAGAAEHYRRALAGGPDDAATRANLGMALVQLGELDQAVAEFQAALRLDPKLPETRLALSGVLSRLGRHGEAVETLRAGLAITAHHVGLTGALAWILSTCPDDSIADGAEAVRLAEQAVRAAGPGDAGVLKTLAAAQAQAGDFDLALRTARRALGAALLAGDQRLAELVGAEIECFQNRKPYRPVSADLQ